jgi:hypothetical protein
MASLRGAHTKRKFKYGKELSPRGLECEALRRNAQPPSQSSWSFSTRFAVKRAVIEFWSVELFHLPARAHENMSAIPDNGRLCRDFRGIFQ